jgi:hypothetical protein
MLTIGILVFIKNFSPDGMLFGAFHVNALHNVFHILTGLIALWVSFSSADGSKAFFQVFGIIYVLVAVLGFSYGDKPVLGLIANNLADSWFHLIVGLLSLYFGFIIKSSTKEEENQEKGL